MYTACRYKQGYLSQYTGLFLSTDVLSRVISRAGMQKILRIVQPNVHAKSQFNGYINVLFQGRNDSAMLRSLKKLFTATTLRTADSYASFCMHEMMLCKTIATENSSPMVLQVSYLIIDILPFLFGYLVSYHTLKFGNNVTITSISLVSLQIEDADFLSIRITTVPTPYDMYSLRCHPN